MGHFFLLSHHFGPFWFEGIRPHPRPLSQGRGGDCSLSLYRLESKVFQDRGSCLRRNDGLFQTMHPLSCERRHDRKDTTDIMVRMGYAELQGASVTGQSRLKAHVMLSPSAWLRVNPAEASKLLPAGIVQGPHTRIFHDDFRPFGKLRVTIMPRVTVILLSNLGSIGGSLRRNCLGGGCQGGQRSDSVGIARETGQPQELPLQRPRAEPPNLQRYRVRGGLLQWAWQPASLRGEGLGVGGKRKRARGAIPRPLAPDFR